MKNDSQTKSKTGPETPNKDRGEHRDAPVPVRKLVEKKRRNQKQDTQATSEKLGEETNRASISINHERQTQTSNNPSGRSRTHSKSLKESTQKQAEVKRIRNADGKLRPIVYKEREYKIYFAWLTIPPILLGKDTKTLRDMGIKDEDLLELTQIGSKTEFAERYKVARSQLHLWDRKLDAQGILEAHDKNMEALTRNVDAAFYAKTLTQSDAPRVELWHKLFGKLKGVPEPGGGDTYIQANIQNNKYEQIFTNIAKKYDAEFERELRDQIRGAERERPSGTD